jgi:hypothetical protein
LTVQWRSFALAVALPLFASLARAQTVTDEPRSFRERSEGTPFETRAELSSLLGAARSSFFVPEFPEVFGQVLLVRAAVTRRIAPSLWVGLAVPLALTSIRQPAGAYVDEAAWGNPTLALQYDWGAPPPSGIGVLHMVRAIVGAPLSERGPRASQMANRALALADALHALRDPASYTPGVASLTLAYRSDFVSGAWRFGPGVSVPLLVRVDDADLPATQTRAVGLRPRVDARAMYYPKRWLGVGIEGSLAIDVMRVTEPIGGNDARQRAQPSLRPEVVFDEGRFRAVLSCTVAIGGTAQGSTGCGAEGMFRY